MKAESFRKTFIILWKIIFTSGFNLRPLNPDSATFMFPLAVNCALSCELFIKGMLKEEKIKRIHTLSKLFNELKEESKRDIILIYETLIKEETNHEEHLRHGIVYDKTTFYEHLEICSNTFTKWRYSNSTNEFKTIFMYFFLESLYKFSQENEIADNSFPDY